MLVQKNITRAITRFAFILNTIFICCHVTSYLAATDKNFFKLKNGQEITIARHTFDLISSTQTWSKEHLEDIPVNGWMVVTTKKQSAGIGTNGRTWHSPEGNIYATFSKKISKNASLNPETERLQVEQVASFAVIQTLEYLGLKPQLKWVNDILLNRKKISGVLVELDNDVLIIGIGFNINMNQKEADRVNEVCKGDPNLISVTSLLIEEGHMFSVEDLFKTVQENLCNNMSLLLDGKFDSFVGEIEKRLTCKIGEEVTVHLPTKREFQGAFKGLNKNGSAIIDVPGKGIVEINDGRMALVIQEEGKLEL